MKSIYNMLQQLKNLLNTEDLNPFETRFIKDVNEQAEQHNSTTHLSSKQVELIEKLYSKNFGD